MGKRARKKLREGVAAAHDCTLVYVVCEGCGKRQRNQLGYLVPAGCRYCGHVYGRYWNAT